MVRPLDGRDGRGVVLWEAVGLLAQATTLDPGNQVLSFALSSQHRHHHHFWAVLTSYFEQFRTWKSVYCELRNVIKGQHIFREEELPRRCWWFFFVKCQSFIIHRENLFIFCSTPKLSGGLLTIYFCRTDLFPSQGANTHLATEIYTLRFIGNQSFFQIYYNYYHFSSSGVNRQLENLNLY